MVSVEKNLHRMKLHCSHTYETSDGIFIHPDTNCINAPTICSSAWCGALEESNLNMSSGYCLNSN